MSGAVDGSTLTEGDEIAHVDRLKDFTEEFFRWSVGRLGTINFEFRF